MNANALKLEEVQVEEKEMFQNQLDKQQVEENVIKVVSNNEIAKERKVENDMLKEDIARLLGDADEPTVVELPNGEFAVIKIRKNKREVLDREALAHVSKIDKDEFKSQLDFAMLVKQGKITTSMIKHCMAEKESKTVSIRVVKTNPLAKKRKKFKKNSF
ncbi:MULTISPECIES: hypothetical protein [Bacillus cereus group]|uniref:hypothetical protein n=1 Tax=Bacillus cereus group TaxID=86661 RepID=UPI0022E2099C|nr:hypothetical protein [Bacillus cereus group sp. TH152-1LC]MDA1675024.1 hypothetical protein [Bacillus cereus group sp. TH152-1LC]